MCTTQLLGRPQKSSFKYPVVEEGCMQRANLNAVIFIYKKHNVKAQNIVSMFIYVLIFSSRWCLKIPR